MAQSKKPRKRYKEKPVHLPMMAESRDRMAMKLHLNVEALIASPSSDAFNELCKKVSALTDALSHLRGRPIFQDKDAAANAIRTCVATLTQIHERAERTDTLAVTEVEALSLRNASGALDVALAKIPKNVLDASILITKRMTEERVEAISYGYS